MSELVDTKTCDFLEQDAALRGQNYVCLSFLSPEDVLKQKEVFLFNKFINTFANDMSDFFTTMAEKYENDIGVCDMLKGLRQKYDYVFGSDELQNAYNFFKSSNSAKLEGEYLEKNSFQTSIRGIKIRGTYETFPEAKKRAEMIKKFDPNFDVFVAQVGCWCPWSPNPEDIQQVEYSETELNTLMKKYKENQEKKDELYRLRKDDMVQSVKLHNEQVGSVTVVEDTEDNKLAVGELLDQIEQVDAWTKAKEENQNVE